MADAIRLGEPESTYMEDVHRYVWAEHAVAMTLERFQEERNDTRCELTVEVNRAPRPFDRRGFLLLLGPNSLRDWVRDLSQAIPTIDWATALNEVRQASLHRMRTGEPVIDLMTAELQAPSAFLIPPVLLDRGVTTWFGDGGSGKSVLAMAACYAISCGGGLFGVPPSRACNTMYLDWEDDSDTHAERLRAIAARCEPSMAGYRVTYQRQVGPIKDRVRELRRTLAEREVGFIVIDSVGMAGADPDSATEVVGVYNAARALGVPALAIHHIAKDAKDRGKPYGSVYAHNASRYSVRIDSDRQGSLTRVAMEPIKTNRTAGQDPLGVDINFINEAGGLVGIDLTITDYRKVRAAKDPTEYDKIVEVLRANQAGLGVDELAEASGVGVASIRTVVSRSKGSIVNIGTPRSAIYALGYREYLNDEGYTQHVTQQPNDVAPALRNTPPLIGGVTQPDTDPRNGSGEEELPW